MTNDSKTRLFEDIPIPRAVATLSIPTIISNLVALLYTLADTFFVGMLNDPVETAAVTLSAPVVLAFNAINNLFGVGSSSMMSRALGRRDFKTLRESSAFGFYGALVSAIAFSGVIALFLSPLLRLLGADSTTHYATSRYMLWTVCIGATPAIMNVLMAYLVRSEGATLHASIGTMSGCILNILLDPLFILPSGLNLGAEGAALATMIANCCALLYFFGYLIFKRKSTYVCISPKAFTLRKEVVSGVCSVGIPASIQNLLNVASQMILNNLASAYGAAALAGMGIASRISMIPWYISNGISQGVMPLIGYNYASRNYARMKRALGFTYKISMVVLFSIAVTSCIFSRQVTGLFIDDPQSIAYGSSFLYGKAMFVPFLSLDFLAVGTFQAIGKGSKALVMAIIRKVVIEIPVMYLLNFLWPLYGLSCAQLVSEFCMAVIGSCMIVRLLKNLDTSLSARQELA